MKKNANEIDILLNYYNITFADIEDRRDLATPRQ